MRKIAEPNPDDRCCYSSIFMTSDHVYLTVWEKCLLAFKNWSPSQVKEWSAPIIQVLENPETNSRVMAESGGPMRWVTPLLVPVEITQNLNSQQLARLYREIELIIEDHQAYAYFQPEFDWNAAKVRTLQYLESLFIAKRSKKRDDNEG